MTMQKTALVLFVALLAMLATPAFAQLGDDGMDERIKKQLENLGLKYTTTDKGNFKVVFSLKNDRTQLVVINSNTYQFGGMEIREITAPVKMTQEKSGYSHTELFNLLEKNNTYKLGAWQINGGTSPFVLQFAVRISANASQDVLDSIIRMMATTADDMELELTGEDEF